MKLLWLCNMVPGPVGEAMTGKPGRGLWVDHVLSDLRKTDIALHILCPGPGDRGRLDEKRSFATFREGKPWKYMQPLEDRFLEEVTAFAPDVVHIWGTEFGHTLAMVNACQRAGLLHRVVISIQGLCSVYASHYAEGIPERVYNGFTFRDFVRQDNIRQQQAAFARRGVLEVEALKKVRHVMGRTCWDRACTELINPAAQYHLCNETLRETFYQGQWRYEGCRKHRIFASACGYPVKGFHYLLEAVDMLREEFPDISVAVTGESPLELGSWKKRLGESMYQRYLARLLREKGLQDRVEFLGGLDAGQMKQQYLLANVFALPSTIENSPNSLAEAMLLGAPCVASGVGGVSTMLSHEQEGFLYQSTAPYMLAYYIRQVFRMEDRAQALGAGAAEHARLTHDPETNLKTLLAVYEEVAQ